jgi:hypothetical protein
VVVVVTADDVICKECLRGQATYSPGNAFVVYEISKHVFPTAPSPTTTHLIACISPCPRRTRAASQQVPPYELAN